MLPASQLHMPPIYSTSTFLVVFIFSACYAFLFYYVVSNLVLHLYSESKSLTRKLIFSAVCGVIETVYICVIFYTNLFANSKILTSELGYDLISTIDPLFVYIFYILSVKILRLSRRLSLHLMAQIYICVLMSRMSCHFISTFVFPQGGGLYDYAMDVLSIISAYMINMAIYFLAMIAIEKGRFTIIVPEDTNDRPSARDIIKTAALLCISYLTAVIVPYLLYNNPVVYLLLTIVFGLVFTLVILMNVKSACSAKLAKKDAYIQSLSNANENFKLVKHDFYNILSTYSGYIQTGDMEKLKKYHEKLLNITMEAGDLLDLNDYMNQAPALISLIIVKVQEAKKVGVVMHISIQCNIEPLHFDSQIFSRALACLLDNAIEAASISGEKRVNLFIEQIKNGRKQITLINSIGEAVDIDRITQPGFTTKEGHTGLGLKEAFRILEENGYIIKISQSDGEFTVLVETPSMTRYSPAGHKTAKVTY